LNYLLENEEIRFVVLYADTSEADSDDDAASEIMASGTVIAMFTALLF